MPGYYRTFRAAVNLLSRTHPMIYGSRQMHYLLDSIGFCTVLFGRFRSSPAAVKPEKQSDDNYLRMRVFWHLWRPMTLSCVSWNREREEQ